MAPTRRNRISLLAIIFLSAFLPAGSIAAAQEEVPDLSGLCADIEREYSIDIERDVEGILWAYDRIERVYPESDTAGRKAILSCLKKAFAVRPSESTLSFQKRAAECLTTMGKPGLSILLSGLKNRTLVPRDDEDEEAVAACLTVRAVIIEAVGACKNLKTIKLLYKHLAESDARIIGAAARALAHFHELPLQKRKPIVEVLIKRYSNLATEGKVTGRKAHEGGRRRGKDGDHAKLFDASPALNEALRKLTGQMHYTAALWKAWYKGHKNEKEWEPDESEGSRPVRCPVTGKSGNGTSRR
jgi:hypothetical protein